MIHYKNDSFLAVKLCSHNLLAKTYVQGSLKWFMEAFPLNPVTREIGCLSKSLLE